MNILIIARADHSGAGYALSQAINGHTEHSAKAVSYHRSWIQYPYDILNPTKHQLAWLLDWADVINCHDEYKAQVDKPIVMTYHGTYYRRQMQKLDQRDKSRGYAQTVLTLDLAEMGATWIGRAMPDLSKLHNPGKHFTICHSPTKRYTKGTNSIIGALQDTDIRLLLIENIPHRKCIEEKSKCHALIDQVGKRAYGYGTNALEAWSMGMPVISGGSHKLLLAMESTFGYLPFLAVHTKEDIVNWSTRLRDDPKFYQKWRDIGKEFIARHHAPSIVARRFIEICESVM